MCFWFLSVMLLTFRPYAGLSAATWKDAPVSIRHRPSQPQGPTAAHGLSVFWQRPSVPTAMSLHGLAAVRLFTHAPRPLEKQAQSVPHYLLPHFPFLVILLDFVLHCPHPIGTRPCGSVCCMLSGHSHPPLSYIWCC